MREAWTKDILEAIEEARVDYDFDYDDDDENEECSW